MIKAVVFDLWGTLFRNYYDHDEFVAKASAVLGKPFNPRLYEEVRSTRTGISTEDAAKQIIERHGLEPTPELMGTYLQLWFEFINAKKELYPDSIETLKAVKAKGFKIALLSNCGETTLKFVQDSNLKDYVDVLHLSCLTGHIKPDRDAFDGVLADLKVKPGEAVMVGDNIEHDIRPAKAFGMKAVLVNRDGSKPGKELADASIKSLKELIPVLEKLK